MRRSWYCLCPRWSSLFAGSGIVTSSLIGGGLDGDVFYADIFPSTAVRGQKRRTHNQPPDESCSLTLHLQSFSSIPFAR